MRRWALAAAIVVALLAGAVWWLASSEGALQWAARRLEAMTGGQVRIESPAGTLLGPIRAARVTYADEGIRVTAEEVALDARLLALAQEKLDAQSLRAASLRIELLPSPATGPPDALGLPLEVAIARVEVGTVTLVDGATTIELREVAGAYRGGPSGHRVELERARTPWGDASGVATLGAEKPFPVEGGVRFARATPPWTVDATAGLAGTLQSMHVRIDGRLGAAPVEANLGLAPFEARWLARAEAIARDVDLAAFVDGAPRTAATIRVNAASDERGSYAGDLALDNAAPGTLTAGRVPLARATSAFAFDGRTLQLAGLAADLGAAGRAQGEGELDERGSRWNLAVDGLNLRGLHAPLRATRLEGRIVARLDEGAQHLDVDLREKAVALAATAVREGDVVKVSRLRARAGRGELTGEGTVALAGARAFEARARFARFDPAQFGDWPPAELNGEATARGALEPDWRADVRVALNQSRFRGVPLAGGGTAAVTARGVRDADATLTLGANRVRATGGLGRPGDALALEVDARDLAQLDARASGRLVGRGTLTGAFDRLGGAFEARGENLRLLKQVAVGAVDAKGELSADPDRALALQLDARKVALPQLELTTVRGRAEGRLSAHAIDLAASGEPIDAIVRLEGGWDDARGWRGGLARLENRGAYPVALDAPAPLELARDRVVLGAATLRALDGVLAVQRLAWADGRLSTAGRARGVPAAPLLALAGWRPPRGSDLALGGEWSIEAAPRLNGTVRLARERGDLLVPASPALPLGLERLEAEATFRDDAVALVARVRATALGEAVLEADAGGLAPDARLAGRLRADLPTLRLLDEQVGTTAIIDGRAALDVALGGTVGAPTFAGPVTADGVRVDLPQYGVALRDGRARARLDGDTLALDELVIRGPAGELTASGTLARGGEGARLAWRADRLRIFNRPDRRLAVTGAGTAAISAAKLQLRGELRADEGYIEFAQREGPRLGDDVVIAGRAPKPRAADRRALPLDLDVTLDPGPGFRIAGQGLETRLRGKVRVRSREDGMLVAKGEIEAVEGTYRAFGQKLDIERGRLIFDGALENPALDVLALRRNLQVEAGVELTGTVRAPQVRLTSRPPVPDAEKMSWLVLGRPVSDASGADLALLQAAASSLISSDDAVPIHRRIIQGVGLDDVALRPATGAATSAGSAGGNVVAFGKRLSDRLYLEYEQGLNVVTNLVRLSFALTRTLSVRAETSQTTSSVGVNYRRSFD